MAREAISESPLVHLRPHEPVAERVLLCGDPGRALRLAQMLVDGPRMLNHHRGLWGYSGPALADARPLTIQGTGTGGPSAAIVVDDLSVLGARRLVRVGTCAALVPGLALGDLVAVDRVLARDGTSRALGAAAELVPDPVLTARLSGGATATGTVASTDVPGGPAGAGAVVRDLQSAAVLAAAARRGLAAAAVLLVTQTAGGERLDPEALHDAEGPLGRLGAAALGAGPAG